MNRSRLGTALAALAAVVALSVATPTFAQPHHGGGGGWHGGDRGGWHGGDRGGWHGGGRGGWHGGGRGWDHGWRRDHPGRWWGSRWYPGCYSEVWWWGPQLVCRGPFGDVFVVGP
jgi:hypothetical protein